MAKLIYAEDSRGIYGLEFNDETEDNRWHRLVVRPDKFGDARGSAQKVLYHGIGRRFAPEDSEEVVLANVLASKNVRKSGLEYEPGTRMKFSRKEQRRYWAIVGNARHVLNGMWKHLIETAADQRALHMARRFAPQWRRGIYEACATSERMRQLVETFPMLATEVCRHHGYGDDHLKEAREMVERGARLKDVAAVARVPLCLRKLKPRACFQATICREFVINQLCDKHADLIHAFLPESGLKQSRWITALTASDLGFGNIDEVVRWAAKNADLRLKQADLNNAVNGIRDWYRNESVELVGQFGAAEWRVKVPLTCSWQTAVERAEEWHRRREFAQNAHLSVPFPRPWVPEMSVRGYRFVPLTDGQALVDEGNAMHHCVGSYAQFVRLGQCYIYSVRRGDKRLATIEVGRARLDDGDRLGLRQIRAVCNAEPAPSVKAAAAAWLAKAQELVVFPTEAELKALPAAPRGQMPAANNEIEVEWGLPF